MPKLDLLKETLPLLVLSVLREDELYGYEIPADSRIRQPPHQLDQSLNGNAAVAGLHGIRVEAWHSNASPHGELDPRYDEPFAWRPLSP